MNRKRQELKVIKKIKRTKWNKGLLGRGEGWKMRSKIRRERRCWRIIWKRGLQKLLVFLKQGKSPTQRDIYRSLISFLSVEPDKYRFTIRATPTLVQFKSTWLKSVFEVQNEESVFHAAVRTANSLCPLSYASNLGRFTGDLPDIPQPEIKPVWATIKTTYLLTVRRTLKNFVQKYWNVFFKHKNPMSKSCVSVPTNNAYSRVIFEISLFTITSGPGV